MRWIVAVFEINFKMNSRRIRVIRPLEKKPDFGIKIGSLVLASQGVSLLWRVYQVESIDGSHDVPRLSLIRVIDAHPMSVSIGQVEPIVEASILRMARMLLVNAAMAIQDRLDELEGGNSISDALAVLADDSNREAEAESDDVPQFTDDDQYGPYLTAEEVIHNEEFRDNIREWMMRTAARATRAEELVTEAIAHFALPRNAGALRLLLRRDARDAIWQKYGIDQA